MEIANHGDYEHSQEYEDGRTAFINNIPVDNCPHTSTGSIRLNNQRYSWLSGWYAARIDKQFPPKVENNEI